MNRTSSGRAIAAAILASSFVACAQLVGAGFDDVHSNGGSGSQGSVTLPDGSTSLSDGAAFLPDGAPGAPSDGAAAGDTGPFIGIDGGTVLVDASCGGGTTSISGTVYDPAGTNPLYDVLVYVPSAALAPIPSQLTCDRCGAMPSGSPVAIALSDATGHFKLDGVPAGANVPIVVQTGKWRRLQFVPTVAPCADNPLTDPNLTRLPRSATEGSLPRIAIATSALDPFECVLKKFGIDGNEFSAPGGAGHVQLFAENGASMGGPLPDAGSQATLLYGDPATLQSFDQVLFGCEGQLGTKDPTYAQNLADYLALGGRAWFEHYELAWLQAMPAAYASMITFAPDQTVPTMTLTVETAFPKGSALATWMQKVGVIGGGPPTFSAPDTRGDITSAVGQSWLSASASVTGADGGVVDVGVSEQVSFNTPPSLPASQQCGRVVFSDYHSGDTSTQGPSFPAECDTSSLTPESKALEFMLFDLGGCILPDGVVPSPP